MPGPNTMKIGVAGFGAENSLAKGLCFVRGRSTMNT